LGHIGREGLHLQLAALVLAGSQGDGRRVGVQVEGLRRQAGEGRRSEARPAGRRIQVIAIPPRQPAADAVLASAARGRRGGSSGVSPRGSWRGSVCTWGGSRGAGGSAAARRSFTIQRQNCLTACK